MKVISILDQPPPYEFYRDYRPEINWDTSNNSWVGIWGYDWNNQIGNALLKKNKSFQFEVWQPDLRADKVYSTKFGNGLIHKLYPAEYRKKEGQDFIFSQGIIYDIIKETKLNKILLHICILDKFCWEIVKIFKDLPIVGSFHGEIKLPKQQIFKLRKNIFHSIYHYQNHIELKRIVNYFNCITIQTEDNRHYLERIYNGSIKTLTMGVDFEEFKSMNKYECRKDLNLPKDKKIFLSVSRFNPQKQLDKVIDIFTDLDKDYDFLYVVIGHGIYSYEQYLKKVSSRLLRSKKIIFPGYIRGQELVKYYNAADLFLMTSKSEAGPVVSMEALACNLPILSTNTGNVANFLKKNNAGVIVKKKQYKYWLKNIIYFLDGKEIRKVDRDVSKEHYDWESIASVVISIYNAVLKR